MAQLFSNVGNLTWQQAVMWLIGGILIYLAVKAGIWSPLCCCRWASGAILVNLPLSGAVTQIVDGVEEIGVLNVLFDAGIANELFPLLLFVGIGAMIDFEPLLNDPKLMFFGAAAQFGIFFTFQSGRPSGLSHQGRGGHRHHRRGRRSDGDLYGEFPEIQLSGRDHGGGVFVYGAGADRPAAGHPCADHNARAADPHAVSPAYGQQTHEDPVPDHHHRRLRHRLAAERGAGGLF